MKNANQKIVENNFHVLEKAVASTAREETEVSLKMIKKAVKELRLYLPNKLEERIREYFIYGCTPIGRGQFAYSKANINNKALKEAAACIDWEHI